MLSGALPYALLAQKVYSSVPLIGEKNSSARAIFEDGTFAFPGTDNLACWLADLNCDVEQASIGMVHQGFNQASLKIRDAVVAVAKTYVGDIRLVGHSEGAALALILAGYLCLAGRPPVAVYGFEPPRVSIDNLLGGILRAAGVQTLLTNNGNDIVPQVPRLNHPWQFPAPLTAIGKATLPVWNVEDHLMAAVVEAVRGC